MAKRELSSRLQQMKFMQRGKLKEDAMKNKIEEQITENAKSQEIAAEQWIAEPSEASSVHATRPKCIIVMDRSPPSGVNMGRMSFQDFNPEVQKLTEEMKGLVGKSTKAPTVTVSDEHMARSLSGRSDGHHHSKPPAEKEDGESSKQSGRKRRGNDLPLEGRRSSNFQGKVGNRQEGSMAGGKGAASQLSSSAAAAAPLGPSVISNPGRKNSEWRKLRPVQK